MKFPTVLGYAALAPRYMSPEQIADLVERTRLAMTTAALAAAVTMTSGASTRHSYRTTSRSSCAARYARLVGCSITRAARTFGLSRESVNGVWNRLYPDVPARVCLRGRP